MDEKQNYNILVVDDDLVMSELLCEILKPHYNVYSARTGEAALKKAREKKPDLILLDVLMPNMSGFEVIEELKRFAVTRDTPVIFITGQDEVENEEQGFKLGAVDYITKPFHSSIVMARIQSQLKLINRVRETDDASIMVKTRQESRDILFRELMYVDISGHWLNFHLADGKVAEVYATIKQYEDVLLADPRFARCHKSFLVNMQFVEVVEVRELVLKNKTNIPISKGFANFKKQYRQWADGAVK